MGFLGFLVQAITAILLMYRGYYYQEATWELNLAVILGAPLLLMIGSAIKHNAKASHVRRGFFGTIWAVIGNYIAGVVACAIFFGIGIGLYYILVLRPAEGTGRY